MLMLVNHKGRADDARKAIKEAGAMPLVSVPATKQIVARDPEPPGVYNVVSKLDDAVRRGALSGMRYGDHSLRHSARVSPALYKMGRAKHIVQPTAADVARVLKRDALRRPTPAGAPPTIAGRPANWNSAYMVRRCALTVFFVQGPAADCPQWNDDLRDTVVDEILGGLSWLAQEVNKDGAAVEFVLDLRDPNSIGWNPLNNFYTPMGDCGACLSLASLGFDGSHAGGDAFNASQRTALGCDMATMAVVCIGSRFADDYSAYAWMGGPWCVLTTENGGWGIGLFNRVLAHELLHGYGAADLYDDSGMDSNSTTGWLTVRSGADFGRPSLMCDLSLSLADCTLGQIGAKLQESDPDTTADALQYLRGGDVREDMLAVSDLDYGAPVPDGEGEISFTLTNNSLVTMTDVCADWRGGEGATVFLGGIAGEIEPGESVSASVLVVWWPRDRWPDRSSLVFSTAEGWRFSHEFSVPPPEGPVDNRLVEMRAPDPGEPFRDTDEVGVEAVVRGLPIGEHIIEVSARRVAEPGTVLDVVRDTRRIVVVAAPQQSEWIIDDKDPERFGVVGSGWRRGGAGSWATKGVFPGGFGDGDKKYMFLRDWQGTAADYAWWRFVALPSGRYAIYATWVEGATRTARAPWRIMVNGRSAGIIYTNMQERPPENGWYKLAEWPFVGGVIEPHLGRGTDGCVIADAVKVERVGD